MLQLNTATIEMAFACTHRQFLRYFHQDGVRLELQQMDSKGLLYHNDAKPFSLHEGHSCRTFSRMLLNRVNRAFHRNGAITPNTVAAPSC